MANVTAEQVVTVLNQVFEEDADIVTALGMLAHSAKITRSNARLGLAKAAFGAAQAQYDAAVAEAEADKEAAEAALAQFVAGLG